MDPFYRFAPFKSPLFKISWNAALGCDAHERMAGSPQADEALRDIRSRHGERMLADGITHSALDAMPARVPYFCYLGFALGEFGIRPLEGCFGLRWYPVREVRAHWEREPAASERVLERTISQIEKKYGVILKSATRACLP